MHRVEILQADRPDDFLVAEKKVSSFLKQIHDEINKSESYHDRIVSLLSNPDASSSPENTLIGVFQTDLNLWLRGRIIEAAKSFGRYETVLCYLIDTGETVRAPLCDCKFLENKKLASIPPLGRRCRLYGVRPASPDFKWSPHALKFFSSICDSGKQPLNRPPVVHSLTSLIDLNA